MRKGFYEQGKIDGYDFLERLDIGNGIKINASQYLHGCCDDFAIVLSDKYKYEIVFALDKDEEGYTYLLHAFAKYKYKDISYYIDVRGITDNLEDVLDEFDWSDELSYIEFNNSGEALKYLKEFLALIPTEDSSDIEILLETYRDYYDISLISK